MAYPPHLNREGNVDRDHSSTVALTHQCGNSYRRFDRRPARTEPPEQAQTLAVSIIIGTG